MADTDDVSRPVFPDGVTRLHRAGMALAAPTSIHRHVTCPVCFALVDFTVVIDHWDAVHPVELARIIDDTHGDEREQG